ncbi:MAG: ribosome biogenesis GTPase YqeH [Bacilli bacterium]
MSIKCPGCGATFQSTNDLLPGYIDEKILNGKRDTMYCKRCFNLQHYSKNLGSEINLDQYTENIKYISQNNGLIVLVIDATDIDGTLINDINSIYKTDNIILVVNKMDLINRDTNLYKFNVGLQKLLDERDIHVQEVAFYSAHANNHQEGLIKKIDFFKTPHKDIYFVGVSNVGKSSIINQLITRYDLRKSIITTSNYFETTLDNIKIPYKGSNIVDTLGFINPSNIINYVSDETHEIINSNQRVRPKTLQLERDQTIFIGGFVRIDFIEGEKINIVAHLTNDKLIHRTKLSNADEYYKKHCDDLLKYPNEEEKKKLGQLRSIRVNTQDKRIDICIHGLGYITVSQNTIINIQSFEKIGIEKREMIV